MIHLKQQLELFLLHTFIHYFCGGKSERINNKKYKLQKIQITKNKKQKTKKCHEGTNTQKPTKKED
jgi:hypothetical protein